MIYEDFRVERRRAPEGARLADLDLDRERDAESAALFATALPPAGRERLRDADDTVFLALLEVAVLPRTDLPRDTGAATACSSAAFASSLGAGGVITSSLSDTVFLGNHGSNIEVVC